MKLTRLYFLFVFISVSCSTTITEKEDDKSMLLKSDSVSYFKYLINQKVVQPNNLGTVIRHIDFYSDTIDTRVYNKIVFPIATSCESFWRNRALVKILDNIKVRVERQSGTLYLINKSSKMWVCNMPQEVTDENIGDSIVVSGFVYNIFGAERVLGEPTILTVAAMKEVSKRAR